MAVYEDIKNIEKEIAETLPPVIYKFRNWDNDNHKTIITQREVYFAHPHELNDPFDVRPPYNFIAPKIDEDVAREKIKFAGRKMNPTISEEELDIEVEQRLKDMIGDPVAYFKKNKFDFVHDKSKYDKIGVLSLCSTFDNASMWAHYGNNSCGFAVGFNTAILVQSLKCSFGVVDYNDTPLDYHIMGDNSGLIYQELFRKSTKWQPEEEIRFVTV